MDTIARDERGAAGQDAAEVTIGGQGLTIAHIAHIARGGRMRLSSNHEMLRRIDRSCRFIDDAVAANLPIYGVTTCFGGLADRVVPAETAAELQQNLVWSHKAATGERLPLADVRAGMALRLNSLARGISGVRLELLRRFEIFLNAHVTPHVREFGSIGASGDLVPLAYVAGAITGLDSRYTVDFDGEELDALAALGRLGLAPLPLKAKEGLALINGTSISAGIAALCADRARRLLALTLGAHALFIQALRGSNQSFHPFIHEHKPHPGQLWAARHMLGLLDGSQMIRDENSGRSKDRAGSLIQDRYSIRCLPQFLGPIVDGLAQIAAQVEVEANSVTDNPLIDADAQATYHCGNFLAQYIGVAMDQLRFHVGMMAKHLDVQIALLVAPEFNDGLPPSLIGNPGHAVSTGLKALQLTANSIMPMLTFFGHSLVDRFPTHAEQFNQNVNSLALGSANLARRSLDIFEQYVALALIFGVQAADLRSFAMGGDYDARPRLSPASARLYEAVRRVTGRAPAGERPFLGDDRDHFLDSIVAQLRDDIAAGGESLSALGDVHSSIERHRSHGPVAAGD